MFKLIGKMFKLTKKWYIMEEENRVNGNFRLLYMMEYWVDLYALAA